MKGHTLDHDHPLAAQIVLGTYALLVICAAIYLAILIWRRR